MQETKEPRRLRHYTSTCNTIWSYSNWKLHSHNECEVGKWKNYESETRITSAQHLYSCWLSMTRVTTAYYFHQPERCADFFVCFKIKLESRRNRMAETSLRPFLIRTKSDKTGSIEFSLSSSRNLLPSPAKSWWNSRAIGWNPREWVLCIKNAHRPTQIVHFDAIRTSAGRQEKFQVETKKFKKPFFFFCLKARLLFKKQGQIKTD